MPLKKVGKQGCLFNRKRYWYHISTTLKKDVEHLIPWGNKKGCNRSDYEPDGERICVAPTIEQCITAVPYILSQTFTIYRTNACVKAMKPHGVFDMKVTGEGWLQIPTTFVKVGSLDFEDVERGLKVENVIEQAASLGEAPYSGKVLRWWKRARIKRFVKSS